MMATRIDRRDLEAMWDRRSQKTERSLERMKSNTAWARMVRRARQAWYHLAVKPSSQP